MLFGPMMVLEMMLVLMSGEPSAGGEGGGLLLPRVGLGLGFDTN